MKGGNSKFTEFPGGIQPTQSTMLNYTGIDVWAWMDKLYPAQHNNRCYSSGVCEIWGSILASSTWLFLLITGIYSVAKSCWITSHIGTNLWEIKIKIQHFEVGKWLWNCQMHNVCHFVPAWMSQKLYPYEYVVLLTRWCSWVFFTNKTNNQRVVNPSRDHGLITCFYATSVLNETDPSSSMFLLMTWGLFGSRTSTTIMMTRSVHIRKP